MGCMSKCLALLSKSCARYSQAEECADEKSRLAHVQDYPEQAWCSVNG